MKTKDRCQDPWTTTWNSNNDSILFLVWTLHFKLKGEWEKKNLWCKSGQEALAVPFALPLLSGTEFRDVVLQEGRWHWGRLGRLGGHRQQIIPPVFLHLWENSQRNIKNILTLDGWIIWGEFVFCQIPQRVSHTSGASANMDNTTMYKTYHSKPIGACWIKEVKMSLPFGCFLEETFSEYGRLSGWAWKLWQGPEL